MPTAGERGWGFGEFPSRLKQVARELAAAAIWHPPRHDAMSLDSGLAPLELAPTLDIRSGGALSRLGTLISETTIETFAQTTKMQYLEKGIIRHDLLFFSAILSHCKKTPTDGRAVHCCSSLWHVHPKVRTASEAKTQRTKHPMRGAPAALPPRPTSCL